MKIITENEIQNELNIKLKQQSGFDVVLYENNIVNYGFDDEPNFDYCKANNIPCICIGRNGGTFYINAGDIAVGYVAKGLDNSFGLYLNDKFVKYLKSKKLNAVLDNNDILINGYKVFGWSSHYFTEFDATLIVCHFTMSVDLERIKNICKKSMIKIPKGLTEYKIKTDDILNFIKNI